MLARLAVLVLIFGLALVTRLPFFFPAVIDWDESTYVLIGQSILDGHLPYVELWTLKPPLLFAFFAAVLGIGGKTLVAVRLAGAICVTTAAFFVYLIAESRWNKRTGILAASLMVASIGLIPSGQATTTEIVLLPWFAAALYLLARPDESRWKAAAAGALMGVTTLIRLNAVFAVVGVGLFILRDIRNAPGATARKSLAYCAGGLAVLAATCLPYALAGELPLLWKSLAGAPFAYSSSQNSAFSNLLELSLNAVGNSAGDAQFRFGVPWINAVMWIAGAAGCLALWLTRRRLAPHDRRLLVLMSLAAAGTLWGMVSGGAAYPHYLMQLVPFAALWTAALVARVPRSWQMAAFVLAAAVTLVSVRPISAEYTAIWSRVSRGEPLQHGRAHAIAAFLVRENPARRPVYLLSTDHIAYWLAGLTPPTSMATHPSNIWKEYLVRAMSGEAATTETELQRIFDTHPILVVVAEDDFPELNPRAWYFLQTVLARDFILTTEIDGQQIYRRRD